MPRLFTAIDIGADAKSQIADSQVQLATAIRASSLRWTKREQWHITLVFIGEVPDDRAARIVELMREALPHPSFRFELGGLGTFPSRGAPRALWIGVRSGADQIIRVQSLVADRLELAGVERERRPFSPHLTLARWRGVGRPIDRTQHSVARRSRRRLRCAR
jgi:2'-5' RNA ligase